MTDIENTLLQAASEIRRLRRVNEILEAKVEVMNLFGAVFHTVPNRGGMVMGEDIAWQCEKTAKEIADERQRPQAPCQP